MAYNFMDLGMLTWSRLPAEVQAEHQNEEERWLKSWSAYFRLLIYWAFPTQPSVSFKENGLEKKKTISSECHFFEQK